MKAIVATFLLFISSSAFAGMTYTDWPSLAQIDVNKLCQGPDSIQSLEPITRCERYETKIPRGKDRDPITECVEYSTEIRHIPYTYEKTECTKYKTVGGKDNREIVCLEWQTKTVQTQTAFTVPVYRMRTGRARDNMGDQLLYTFEYTIPACN